ncbi:MAG: outer membrane protein assembly factor BamE [Arsenophonus sp.]|nr:MAG: outer membrane protein assembly factor BamE [Arsenophonus sp.]
MSFFYRLLIFLLFQFVISGCFLNKYLIYYPNIDQGNYYSKDNILKIRKGMTKSQVIYILGYPLLKEPFFQSKWYYIFRKKIGFNLVKQETIILSFKNNILKDIKYHSLCLNCN